MHDSKGVIPVWAYFWAALVCVSLLTRSYLPIDETRYVSVAWDMRLNGNYLVPYLNGEIYSQKPPLLFWLFNLGWAVFGVNDLWPRMVSPLFGLAALVLTARAADVLWPGRSRIGRSASLILVSSLLWGIFLTAAMFDMLMVFFTLLGVLGIIHAWKGGGLKGWVMLGAAIGLGILSKGPVILLYTLPVALLAPWWAAGHSSDSWARWYAGVALSVCLGALIGLAWAVPAAVCGGEAYAQAIFWKQSAGRMASSFAHERPFWWYVPLLPVMLFPWSLNPGIWRALISLRSSLPSSPVRLCIAWMVPPFIAFALISGKQPHYLLPLFPAFALLSSLALDRMGMCRRTDPVLPGILLAVPGVVIIIQQIVSPGSILFSRVDPLYGCLFVAAGLMVSSAGILRPASGVLTVSAAGIALVLLINFSLMGVTAAHDVRDLSAYLGTMQEKGYVLSYVGKYHGTFNFLGRLKHRVDGIDEGEVVRWAGEHPGGLIIADERHWLPRPGMVPVYEQKFGIHHTIRVWTSATVMAAQGTG